eukprot:c23181_g2_i1 orf=283-4848(-)
MRADTQLDYAIFQLTPTRTRCELLVVAKGLTYKLASGLLKPFVSHLRAAEEQLAKGGYSIRLEPPDPSRASWFTKGTMERFVRFVSTPEVLERVSSVEVELLELEETSRQQTSDSNESNGLGQADNIPSKIASSQLSPGGKPMAPTTLEKASKASPDGVENGVEESSKQRVLRALDARRMMLQKEQGMAFARALAAGFNLENMDDLVLFAECFGANRLREACIKFLALCKRRQEAGLGLEDLELMAAENAQLDMSYMGAMGVNAMGLTWPDPHGGGLDQLHSPSASNEGKQLAGEDGAEKLTRRGSLDDASREYWQTGSSLRPANGDGEGGPGIVKGHPMMAAWQGQPHSQYMPGVHGHAPYAAMHPGMPNHFEPPYGFTGPARPGQPGLPFPHYLGGPPYMPPPYPEGNGWQGLSPVPPQYWPGNQAHDPADAGYVRSQHQQNVSTPSPREKDVQESAKYVGDDMHDDREEFSNEISADRTRRPARRSASPRRRSASPMRKVQIGRTGGSKRSGMVVIRNINYIAPKAQQQDNKADDDSENSDSWSEDGESDEDDTLNNRAETLRASIEDAVGAVEGKNRTGKDGRRRHSKKEKKKASSKDAVHKRETNSSALSRGDDDAEGDGEDHDNDMAEQKDGMSIMGKRDIGSDDRKNFLLDDGLVSVNRVRQQGSYDPTFESNHVKKQEGRMESQLAQDSVLLSQRDGYTRNTQLHSFDMFEQEHQESKQIPAMDDSYILADSRSTTIARSSATMEPDFEFRSTATDYSQADKRLSDDSFMVLARSAARENSNGDWRMPLNLQSEMPCDQNLDVVDTPQEPQSFEPDDLFMVPERSQDSYKRSWNTPLDYDMQVLAADMMDNGLHSQGNEDVEDGDALVESEVHEEEVEERPKEPSTKKLSEKEAKAKAMKEMLERRRSVGGGRPGRPNPLAEAQLRAEKLRLYKAGLQKSKKEKEEEERKRIEDLRNQRQQRIAARSNPGGSPSSPSLVRGSRTPPPTVSKLSPKVPQKVSSGSSLSPSVNRDRGANGHRVARPALDSPKSSENTVSRSVSSLTELHREGRKTTSVLRASTGSQISSHNMKSDKGAVPKPQSKANGLLEDKVGRTKSSRTDERISRTDSGLAEERFGRSESGRIEEKIGRTGSGRIEDKVGHSESARIVEKTQPSASKTVRRVAPQDGPMLPAKSAKSPTTDNKVVKKTSTVPSKAATQKRSALAPVEDMIIETKALPLPQKEEPKAQKPQSPVKATECEDPSPVLAENGACNEDGNGYVKIVSPALMSTEFNITSSEKASHENEFSMPKASVTVLEDTKEDTSHVGSSSRAESVAGSDDRQLEVEAGSSVGEEYHAPVAHVSPSEDTPSAFTEADLHVKDGHATGHYSPPFAPPSEYSLSPSVNLPYMSPAIQQEFTMEANSNESSTTRSRKKWGDSKAKGLKRLLLMGRKSGRSSAQNVSDIPSEGDEEDSPSSNGKNGNIKFTSDMDTFSDQAAGSVPAQSDAGSANSSSKGSRSIFSLSTFRGKSTVKA